jgi:hypothetical protein
MISGVKSPRPPYAGQQDLQPSRPPLDNLSLQVGHAFLGPPAIIPCQKRDEKGR